MLLQVSVCTWGRVKQRKYDSGYNKSAFKLRNLRAMELFFKASLLIRILRQLKTKMSYGHVTKILSDNGLLSEPTTEGNGNDP